ncbi:MAG: extracellular solute-binding protein [Spirochaetaceae bacterium]|jgi:ABC-type glycerol-3-phosphate transport system substrate-binding protein|nr:extracellular solute-binding protein [Spirochaetaceae bacterium]
MKHRLLIGMAALLSLVSCGAGTKDSGAGRVQEHTEGLSPDQRLTQPYTAPVPIHVVLGYRESEDPLTPKDLTPAKAYAVTAAKEKLNIELIYDWVVNTDQFSAKFGAELAAGNLPDIMLLDPNQFEDLYQQGGLADLTEVWNAYANEGLTLISNHDGQLLNAGKRDGKLYGLPMATYNGQQTSQTYYRMDYLKSVGIEGEDQLPKSIAEFEALLDKLMQTDFDGDGKTGGPVLPAGNGFYGEGLGDFTPVFNAYNASATGYIDDGTGRLVFGGTRQEVADALRKLNEWYGKGYFAKDFAAQNVWAASSPIISGIVAGNYPIVFGSWWIPNWPLNMNIDGQSNAEWAIGPSLTADGGKPNVFVDRYPVNNFVAVSKNCKNPEAVLKLINMSLSLNDWSRPGWEEQATEQEKINKHSYIYTWLPWRVYSPITLVDNQQFLSRYEREGKFDLASMDLSDAPKNDEFNGVLTNYLKWHSGDHSGPVWGWYFSRVASNGGVAKMYDLFTSANIHYNEVFVTTPAIVSYSGELGRLYSTSIIQMIMGDQPLSYFDTLKSQWLNLGGQKILDEVNAWYAGNK